MKPEWVALLIVPVLAGCAPTYHYRVEQDEARRALSELATADSVVVEAIETIGNRSKRLRLAPTDDVVVTTHDGGTVSVVSRKAREPDALLDLGLVDHLEWEESRPGATWVGVGVSFAVVSIAWSVWLASDTGSPIVLLPIIGPAVWAGTERRKTSCPRDNPGCELGKGLTDGFIEWQATTLIGTQIIAAGFTTLGIWLASPTREVDEEPAPTSTAGHWPFITFAPTPGGGAGFQVLGTF